MAPAEPTHFGTGNLATQGYRFDLIQDVTDQVHDMLTSWPMSLEWPVAVPMKIPMENILWRPFIIPDNISEEGCATSSTFASEVSFEYHEHNVWNSMLVALCHFEVGVVLGTLLDEVAMGRIALACHFSLDMLCDKT